MPAKRPGKKPERKPYGQETPKPTWTGGEVEKRVAENKGLIWGFAEKNPWVSMFLSREEIEREGNFVLLRAAIKYNPERGAFSTLVFTALTHHFTDVIKKNQKHKRPPTAKANAHDTRGHNRCSPHSSYQEPQTRDSSNIESLDCKV